MFDMLCKVRAFMVVAVLLLLCCPQLSSANDDILLSTVPSIAGNALRLNGVRIDLAPFGPGSVQADKGGISYNHATSSGKTYSYFAGGLQ